MGKRAGGGELDDLTRHPGDAVRVVLGLGLLGLTTLPVEQSGVPRVEENAFRLLYELPEALYLLLWLPMQLGSLGGIAACTAVALAARRRFLALELALSGLTVWVVARFLKELFDRGRPEALLEGVVVATGDAVGLGYVSGHAAVAAALAATAAPWLPRRLRHGAWALVFIVGAARIYVGAHFPLDVVGGFAVGWAAGSLVHLLLGAPGGRPGAAAVERGLMTLGLTPTSIEWVGETTFVADVDGRRLHVRVLSEDHRDADMVHRGWRRFVSRWARSRPPFVSVAHRLDRAAVMALLAREAGARVPEVVAVRAFAGRIGLLVEEHVEGTRLAEAEPGADDLADLWAQVATLRRARLAHGDLHGRKVVIDGSGRAWLVGFSFGESGADDDRLAADVAELLTALEPRVGAGPALASAEAGIGRPAVGDALATLGRRGRGDGTRPTRAARDRLLAVAARPGTVEGEGRPTVG